jgi:hypothetical protein
MLEYKAFSIRLSPWVLPSALGHLPPPLSTLSLHLSSYVSLSLSLSLSSLHLSTSPPLTSYLLLLLHTSYFIPLTSYLLLHTSYLIPLTLYLNLLSPIGPVASKRTVKSLLLLLLLLLSPPHPPRSDIPRLTEILSSIDPAVVLQKYRALHSAYRAFMWPPQYGGLAYNLTLMALGRRAAAIKGRWPLLRAAGGRLAILLGILLSSWA